MFTPAHDAIVLYAIDETSVDDSTDPATLPDPSATPSLLGYTNLPQTARGLNNSKGFAIGQQGAAYNKRGRIEPTATVEIRPGSVDALGHLFPNATSGILPSLTIYVLVKGQYVDIYRYCKPTTLDWKLGGGGDKQGGEISISAAFWATAYQRKSHTFITNTAALQTQLGALGTPLMWHDVRQFKIGDTSYRSSLMNLSVKVDYGLERKNERPYWGDDNPLSRTSYALLEHHTNVSGEIGLHERLPESLFTDALSSQDWSDITIHCTDIDGKGFDLTLASPFPSDETQGGGESSAEIDHTVPFTANSLKFAKLPTTP